MPETEENPVVRWRETTFTDPQGFQQVRHQMARVVEGPGPIPEGAVATDEPVSDWRLTGERK